MVGTRRPLLAVAIILVIGALCIVPFSGCGGGGAGDGGGGGGTPTTGTISGTVRSGIGTLVPGATVTATVGGQPFITITDATGNYTLRNLPFGVATVNAQGSPLQGAFGPVQVLLDAAQSSVILNIQLSTGPPPPPTFP